MRSFVCYDTDMIRKWDIKNQQAKKQCIDNVLTRIDEQGDCEFGLIAAEEMTETLQQVSDTDFTIWCAEGSLVIRQGSRSVSLQPGDAVSMNAGTPYDLLAGMTGYVCYISA